MDTKEHPWISHHNNRQNNLNLQYSKKKQEKEAFFEVQLY